MNNRCTLDELLRRLNTDRHHPDTLTGLQFVFSAYYRDRTDRIVSTVERTDIKETSFAFHFAPTKFHGREINHVCWSEQDLWHVCDIKEDGLPILGVLEFSLMCR